MRDIEFLPTWYPGVHRRKRAVVIQGWCTLGVVVVLGGVTLGQRWQAHHAELTVSNYAHSIEQSRQELSSLSRKLEFKGELRQQEEIIARLGLNVDTTRVITELEAAMPPKVALTGLSIETQEPPRQTIDQSGLRTRSVSDVGAQSDRRMKVQVTGVAPSDLELGQLVTRLNAVKFFDDVQWMGDHEVSRLGRVMREFQVTFTLNLNESATGN